MVALKYELKKRDKMILYLRYHIIMLIAENKFWLDKCSTIEDMPAIYTQMMLGIIIVLYDW